MSSFLPTLMGQSELQQYMTSEFEQAKQALEFGDYPLAESILIRVLEASHNPLAKFLLAQVFLAQPPVENEDLILQKTRYLVSLSLLESFSSEYSDVLSYRIKAAAYLNDLAGFFESLDDFDQAISCYERAEPYFEGSELSHIVKGNLVEALLQKGHLVYQEDEYSEAEGFYRHALHKDPLHLVALNQLGMCALRLGDFALARFYFSVQAGPEVEKDESDVDAWVNLAETLRNSKRYQSAFRAITVAAKVSPEEESLEADLPLTSACFIQDFYRTKKAGRALASDEAAL
jgi:tetratricopeptide (TPR) repeat protein